MLATAVPVPLTPLEVPAQQRELFNLTLFTLGATAALPETRENEELLARLSGQGIPLLLMMAAIRVSRDRFGGVLSSNTAALAEDLAQAERYRILSIVGRQLRNPDLEPFTEHMVAVATLRAGLSKTAAINVVEAEAARLSFSLPSGAAPLCNALAKALPDGDGGIAPVEPSTRGSAVLMSLWGSKSREELLSVITSAHREDPASVTKVVIRTCQDCLILGHSPPFEWLQRALITRSDRLALLDLEATLRSDVLGTRHLALHVAQTVAHLLEPGTHRTFDHQWHADYARSLQRVSSRLAVVGRADEALVASTSAVDIGRHLAEARPEVSRVPLALSLVDQSDQMLLLGRSDGAFEAAGSAVALSRRVADASQDSTAYFCLSVSLCNLATTLLALGRPSEARHAANEGVAMDRRIVRQHGDAFNFTLANSLMVLSLATEGARAMVEIRVRAVE